MDCLLCNETIGSPDSEATYVTDHFAREHVPGYQRPIRIGFVAEMAHLACITDPTGLSAESLNKWLVHRVNSIEASIKAQQEAVRSEFELIHRAIHALPPELTVEYMKEIYDHDGDNATAAHSH